MSATKSAAMPRIGEPDEVRHGENYSAVRLGAADGWMRYGVRHPGVGVTLHGKVFLKDLLGLTGMEMSCGVIPGRGGPPFLHKHRENEEVYVFVSGRGQMLVDGAVIDVAEGCVVRVAPAGVRSWRNTADEPLVYLVIQAKEGSLTQWTATDGVGVEGAPAWPEG
ncbi:cupin domain-containing protein [Limnoglobus roseus]|uniref:Cupin domain-containing protein n=1 Tax=Limnoglobus roseus TaxID=2598579 RepID=A0A5C1AP66_9BACT|nr:cupin domain-containing protein [Limnoglobus roseus]QEL19947.1 cupin domain-containing protein [Limnoglobus roseus]